MKQVTLDQACGRIGRREEKHAQLFPPSLINCHVVTSKVMQGYETCSEAPLPQPVSAGGWRLARSSERDKVGHAWQGTAERMCVFFLPIFLHPSCCTVSFSIVYLFVDVGPCLRWALVIAFKLYQWLKKKKNGFSLNGVLQPPCTDALLPAVVFLATRPSNNLRDLALRPLIGWSRRVSRALHAESW